MPEENESAVVNNTVPTKLDILCGTIATYGSRNSVNECLKFYAALEELKRLAEWGIWIEEDGNDIDI